MKAILNKVVVELIQEENVNEFGVALGKSESEKFAKGKVITAGEDAKGLKEGDIVWYDRHRASDITIKGKRYFAMDIFNIFVVEDFG